MLHEHENTVAGVQYHLPIRSCVIYLRQDGNGPPPLPWKSANGRKTIDFYYEVIELAKLSTAQLRAFGEIGLLPLVPLTKDGASRDKVDEMFTDLQHADKLDLLHIGKMIASLAFGDKQPDNQDWVLRRYRQMYDRLQDTPVYKEMIRLATEKARAEALRESETMIQVALKTAEEVRRTAEITQKTTEAALEKENARGGTPVFAYYW